MAQTKAQLAADMLALRSDVSRLTQLAEDRFARLHKAVDIFRAQKAEIEALKASNRELSIKLCGQIKRGNLLKARVQG